MSLSREEARTLINRVLGLSTADETTVGLESIRSANLRYARNEITTSGDASDTTLNVRVSFGKRSGSATTNQFDEDSLERTVRKAEEIARFSPEDPEHMPLLAEQKYAETNAFDAATADANPAWRASIAKHAIGLAIDRKLETAGFVTNRASWTAAGNSAGLFAWAPSTLTTYSTTVRTPDGSGSGWGGGNAEAIDAIDTRQIAARAVRKAELSRDPRELAPGTYTVILEPAAVADLLMYMSFSLDARSADEGRSFFSRKGGGNRLGDAILSPRVSIVTDPSDSRARAIPFDDSGLPRRRITIFDQGALRSLSYSRFWAEKMKTEPTASPGNLIMSGGTGSVDDLVRDTRDGVLVTRLWYIRFLDPQTITLTGLTRDGVFRIQDGRLTHALKNFRWNDSPVSVFSSIDAMSSPVRARGSEAEDFSIVCPAIRTRFRFSSLSDAV